MKVYVDTNVVVASVVETHVHHSRSKSLMDSLSQKKHQGFISAHGLTEIYSVMTRSLSSAIQPCDGMAILSDDVIPVLELVSLSNSEYRNIVRDCASMGFGSGRVHDLAHLRAAEKASCEQIYTFDVGGFQALAPNLTSRIVTP